MTNENLIETDVLIIGGGIAGCFAAVRARERGLKVIIVDKAYVGKSGGTASASADYMVFNTEWGHDLEASLSMISQIGEYVNNRDWTKIILKDSWQTYQDLVSWGVTFPLDLNQIKDYQKVLSRTDPSGKRLFAQIPIRRGAFSPALRKQVIKNGIKVMEKIMTTDLLKWDGTIIGAIGFNIITNEIYIFKAKSTIICTGTSSFKPLGYTLSSLTGDGDAMAYRAGAEITGKEFPAKFLTIAAYPAWRSYVGFGGYPNFTDAEGKYLKHTGFWDCSMDFLIHTGKGPIIWNFEKANYDDIERIKKRLQQSEGSTFIYDRLELDIKQGSKIPMSAGAGSGSSDSQTAGIWIVDTKCATTLPGLFSGGECCGSRYVGSIHTGSGFGLTGSAVTGSRAGIDAAEYALKAKKPGLDNQELERVKKVLYEPLERKGGISPRWVTQVLQNTMIPYFILHIKHEKRLQAALTIVEFLRDHLVPKLVARDSHELRLAHETKNMVLNAEMILRASIFRTESRGQHYREDYPRRDDPVWLAWIKLKDENGQMKLIKEPIPKEWWPDLSKPYEERYPIRRFLNE